MSSDSFRLTGVPDFFNMVYAINGAVYDLAWRVPGTEIIVYSADIHIIRQQQPVASRRLRFRISFTLVELMEYSLFSMYLL